MQAEQLVTEASQLRSGYDMSATEADRRMAKANETLGAAHAAVVHDLTETITKMEPAARQLTLEFLGPITGSCRLSPVMRYMVASLVNSRTDTRAGDPFATLTPPSSPA